MKKLAVQSGNAPTAPSIGQGHAQGQLFSPRSVEVVTRHRCASAGVSKTPWTPAGASLW